MKGTCDDRSYKEFMINKVKVSVIIPVYNVENYLVQCIESVMNQTHDNLEIILVDDGSLDKSAEICDEYEKKDNRVKVIHQKNSGVSCARNSGINKSTGDYVCFVDGDDLVMPDYVEYMLSLSVEYGADISLSTRMLGNYNEHKEYKDDIRKWTSEDAVEAILCYKVPIGCYSKLFKREILDDVHFIPDVFIGEGFNFNVDTFQRANFIVAGCHKVYYYRRNNPTSAMTVFSTKKCECGLRALEIIHDNMKIKSERIERAWEFANWRTHSDFYDLFILASAQKQFPELYEKCFTITKTKATCAMKVPTTLGNKIRALIMKFNPKIIPLVMILRKKIYKI